MRSFLATWGQRLQRRWRLLAVLALLLGGAAALAGPHAWAWYHWHVAQKEMARYHGAAALEHLNTCLRVWPASARAHFLASRAARRAGAYDEADRHLRECERLQPDRSEETNLEWALLHATMGDVDAVESYLLSRAEKELDVAPLACEALAEGYGRTYRVYEALNCLDRWLGHQPDNLRALFLRGNVYRQIQRLQKGVPDYRRVVELDPDQDEARHWLAVGLLEVGRYEEALDHLDTLARRRPGDTDVQILSARCQAGLGHFDQARTALDAVLDDHPDHGRALRARGEIELHAGLAVRAETWLRKAARAQPYDYQTQWWLYKALVHQGKDRAAAAQHKVAEDLNHRLNELGEITSSKLSAQPHDPALHCRLGTLLLGLGYDQLAERWLHSALQKDPGYKPAHGALAAFYQAHGNPEKAAFHRQQAEAAAAAGTQPSPATAAARAKTP
jgi:tetratricopeptide (TPR) repeat protein